MYSLRQWHTVHITGIQGFHEHVVNTAQGHVTHQCTV